MSQPSTRRRASATVAVAICVAVVAACAPAPGLDTLRAVKRAEFGQIATNDAAGVAAGTVQPVLEFTVEGTPPSIFVNSPIPDSRAAAFASFVGLPPGFRLAKVAILTEDPAPRYWLSLNVYRVSGLTNGVRAEWSTYVDDGSGIPRFMIVRARASEGSIDPLGPLAPPEPFVHALSADVITTQMNKTVVVGGTPQVTADPLYESTITLPAPEDRHFVTPALEWVRANDFIYWLNGVNDRIFHNSSSHDPRLVSVDLADVALVDDSEWAPFIETTPAHVLVYLDPIEFMIGPWWNVTEPDGRVDPATVARLADVKRGLYSGLTQTLAAGVNLGAAEPVVRSRTEGTSPSVHWHWRIPAAQAAAFATAAGIPSGLDLAELRLSDDEASPSRWLTLHVRREGGPFSGLRADWITYVDDGTRTRSFVIEGRADHAWLDPANLPSVSAPRTPAVAISQVETASTIATTFGSGPSSFSSTIDLSAPTGVVEPSRDWIGSADRRYWRNGAADRAYYSFAVFDARTEVSDVAVTTTGGGPWTAFTSGAPDRVWVQHETVELATNPWWDLSRVR